uniref:Uncharacterized protein n=1 Tax=Panagrolaimus sp. ES5 TaxID=591445 RepID=A0AC34FMV8_9BILA
MNLNNFCYCSQSCLLLFAIISTFIICNESHDIKTFNDAPNESQNIPFVISVPSSRYNTQNPEKEMFNSYLSPLEEKLRKTLSGTPSRRSASHPCRWKLCGAHFGYHSMRRF